MMVQVLRSGVTYVVSVVLVAGCGNLEPSDPGSPETGEAVESSEASIVVGNQLLTDQIITASADTFINGALPASNTWTTFGSAVYIETSSTSESWIRFVVPAPIPNATLTAAELLLTNGCGTDSGSVSGGSIARASFTNENWSEGTASNLLRKNYPPTYGPTLATIGTVALGPTYTFKGLKSAVIGTNGLPRTGPVTFALRSSSTDFARYCSRTSSTPPRLKLTYSETLVTGDSSQFVTQSPPTSLLAGEAVQVPVTFRNNGTTSWTAAAGFALASQAPWLNTTWGSAKTLLASTAAIAPGQSTTFYVGVKAPLTYGTYSFQRQMVHGSTAFGVASPLKSISVVPGPRCRKVWSKYASVSSSFSGTCIKNAPITSGDDYLNWTGKDPVACTNLCSGVLTGCTAFISCKSTFLSQ